MASRIRPGDIVSRRKGPVMHKGIAVGHNRILHNTPFKGEHICSEAEFSNGRRLYVQSLDVQARRRVLQSHVETGRTSRGYNLLTNNCEHTVSRLAQGRAQSPQLRSWVVGTGLAVAAFALTRHPAAAAAAYALGRKITGKLNR